MFGKKMEKKTKIIFIHVCVVLLLMIAVFKFSEEITKCKSNIYYLLQNSHADSKIDFTDYPPIVTNDHAWYKNTQLIFHAGGGIDGLDYTNSKEAMELMFSKDNYFIEVDFMYTSDHELVCMHKWSEQWTGEEVPSLEEFTTGKIFGKYTAMTAKDVVQYMEQHPQLHIIIDTKEEDQTEVVKSLVDLSAGHTDVTDRFIIQLYQGGVKEEIQKIYPFSEENFLFTAYKFGSHYPNKIMKICYDENIAVVTVPYDVWDEETKKLYLSKGFTLFEHTVNRPDWARISLREGVHGFYTDFLSEEDLQDEDAKD